MKLKQFVFRKDCFECGACCSYHEENTVWGPLFMREEIVELVEKNIVPAAIFSDAHADGTMRPHLVKHGNMFLCPCFEPGGKKCKIYSERPLDCQLYPFVLAQKDNMTWLAAAQNCPAVYNIEQSREIKEYIDYLLAIFSSEQFIQLVKNNPGIVQDYGLDVVYLLPLPALNKAIYATSASHPGR